MTTLVHRAPTFPPDAAPRLRARLTARLDGIVWRLTRRRWNRLIARVLCRAYSDGVITSHQLHVLAREFDPTQDGTVGRLPAVTEPRFAERA